MSKVKETIATSVSIDDLQEVFSPENTKAFFTRENLLSVGIWLGKAALIFIIGTVLIKFLIRIIDLTLRKGKLSKSLIYYSESILKFFLYFILVIMVANNLGINTNSLVALAASIGLALSLALKDSLIDLAYGIMIVMTKPIRSGDMVYLEDINDYLEVVDIKLFSTHLRNRNNMRIIVPNERVMQNKIDNLSRYSYVYTDVEIPVPYMTDIDQVKAIISKTLDREERVLSEHPYIIGVQSFEESSVVFLVSAPVTAKDYFLMQLHLREIIAKSLRAEGISMPFPQREVRILNDENQSRIL